MVRGRAEIDERKTEKAGVITEIPYLKVNKTDGIIIKITKSGTGKNYR